MGDASLGRGGEAGRAAAEEMYRSRLGIGGGECLVRSLPRDRCSADALICSLLPRQFCCGSFGFRVSVRTSLGIGSSVNLGRLASGEAGLLASKEEEVSPERRFRSCSGIKGNPEVWSILT